MLEYKGQFTSAKVFTDQIEEEAVQQLYNLMNSPVFEGSVVRIMPDVHAGAGCVIGFTAPLTDKGVVPNLIGVDIGCGVCSLNLQTDTMSFEKLDKVIRKEVPNGFGTHDRHKDRNTELVYSKLVASTSYKNFEKEVTNIISVTNQDAGRVWKSIGTLGGGNHFIEVNKEDNGNLWLTIHSGSRNFGLRIATHYQSIASKQLNKKGEKNSLDYLTGDEYSNYLEAMKVAQTYAKLNRFCILYQIILGLKLDPKILFQGELIESVHNYISFKDNIIRKGAISAHKDERVIIPWNMRDGLIIGTGRGNEDWNWSAPHGAGRIMGRKAAKKALSLDEFKETMKDVWSSCVCNDTLDEAPMAYKDHTLIQQYIEPTIIIDKTLKPVYNFKSSKGD